MSQALKNIIFGFRRFYLIQYFLIHKDFFPLEKAKKLLK